MKKLIKKIQRADDPTKKMWLFVLSGAVTIIVVAAWIFYMKLSIPSASDAAKAQTQQPTAEKPESDSAKTLMTGLKVVADKLKNLANLKNNFTVSNMERNFLVENLKPVPKTELP